MKQVRIGIKRLNLAVEEVTRWNAVPVANDPNLVVVRPLLLEFASQLGPRGSAQGACCQNCRRNHALIVPSAALYCSELALRFQRSSVCLSSSEIRLPQTS